MNYIYTKEKWDGHRSLVILEYSPNWFEKWFLWRDPRRVDYVGLGTKWKIRNPDNTFHDVRKKKLIAFLQSVQYRAEFRQRVAQQKVGVTIKKALP